MKLARRNFLHLAAGAVAMPSLSSAARASVNTFLRHCSLTFAEVKLSPLYRHCLR